MATRLEGGRHATRSCLLTLSNCGAAKQRRGVGSATGFDNADLDMPQSAIHPTCGARPQ
jgi:hypothetical protein